MKNVRRAAAVLGAAGTLTAGGLVLAAPAQAAGFPGTCYTSDNGTSAGGWCDGNGPDYQYQAGVECLIGGFLVEKWGVRRWDGDRRQSIVDCSPGGVYHAWLYEYHLNSTYRVIQIA